MVYYLKNNNNNSIPVVCFFIEVNLTMYFIIFSQKHLLFSVALCC